MGEPKGERKRERWSPGARGSPACVCFAPRIATALPGAEARACPDLGGAKRVLRQRPGVARVADPDSRDKEIQRLKAKAATRGWRAGFSQRRAFAWRRASALLRGGVHDATDTPRDSDDPERGGLGDVDDRVVSAPVIQARLGRRAAVPGDFSEPDVLDLRLAIEADALPNSSVSWGGSRSAKTERRAGNLDPAMVVSLRVFEEQPRNGPPLAARGGQGTGRGACRSRSVAPIVPAGSGPGLVDRPRQGHGLRRRSRLSALPFRFRYVLRYRLRFRFSVSAPASASASAPGTQPLPGSGQRIQTVPSRTSAGKLRTPQRAGRQRTRPSRTSKRAPWRGQTIS